MEVFNYNNYRKYLEKKLGPEGSRTGLRKQLAESLSVHTTFVSQVLKEKAELSLEQAEGVNDFFQHSDEEGEFFILLVLKDRSGTSKLRQRFENKIKTIRDSRLKISKRLGVNNEISEIDREKFYSNYIYGAVHVLSSIPEFQTIEALANKLNLPRTKVIEVTDFLLKIGLLKQSSGKLLTGPQHIHLKNDNEMILKHHINWRMHTIQSLQFLEKDDLHFSACVSLAQNDVEKVKEILLESMESNIKVISGSKEETAFVLSFDFYKFNK